MAKIIRFRLLRLMIICFVGMTFMMSCSQDIPEVVEQANECEWKTAILIFNINEDMSVSRAAANDYEPEPGDMLMIRFENNGKQVLGYASYDDYKLWTLTYQGSLENCSNQKCEVVYIGNNPIHENGTLIFDFDYKNPIFECGEGSYSTINGYIELTATLKPKTMRLRFKGSAEHEYALKGVTCYNKFDLSSWIYSTTNEVVTQTVKITNIDGNYTSPHLYVNPSKYIRLKEGDNVYLLKKSFSDLSYGGRSIVVRLPDVNSTNWSVDTFSSKNEEISYPLNSTSSYLGSNTYSKAGIEFSFCYIITKQSESQTSFSVSVNAFTKSGRVVSTNQKYVRSKDVSLNVMHTYRDFYFHPDADYYEIILLNPYHTEGRASNLTISNF